VSERVVVGGRNDELINDESFIKSITRDLVDFKVSILKLLKDRRSGNLNGQKLKNKIIFWLHD
jgi:hypothetical protein